MLYVSTLTIFMTACASNSTQPGGELGPAMVISVSSDGRYAISTHKSKHLVLWDLQQLDRKILSTNANIYSAYFIHDRNAFLWQDLNDVVRAQTINGEVLKQFEHFPTYGHVMDTSLKHYIASDDKWSLFAGYGDEMVPIKKDGVSPSFLGTGKLLHLSISEDKGLFVSAGSTTHDGYDIDEYPPIAPEQRWSNYALPVLWDLDTLEPIAQLPGNSSKVDAVISPDGQWVVSGDENTIGLYWNTDHPDERHRMADYIHGILLDDAPPNADSSEQWDKSQLIPEPLADEPNRWGNRQLANTTTVALAFIDDSEEFLRFGTYSHWVALFEAGNPWPQKYFDLGTEPWPSTSSYLRSLSIATSPQANVLVIGHRNGGGISVYRYDPDARTLTRTWVAE